MKSSNILSVVFIIVVFNCVVHGMENNQQLEQECEKKCMQQRIQEYKHNTTELFNHIKRTPSEMQNHIMYYMGHRQIWYESKRFKHTQCPYDVNFNENETELITRTGCTAYIWDIARQQCRFNVQHDDAITSIQLNSTGTQLLVASKDGTACIWDIQKNKKDIVMDHGKSSWVAHNTCDVMNAAFNADETKIMTWTSNNTVLLWYSDFSKHSTFDCVEIIESVKFNTDGTKIIVCFGSHLVVLDTTSDILNPILKAFHNEQMVHAAFFCNKDTQLIVVTCWHLYIWDVVTQDLLEQIETIYNIRHAFLNEDQTQLILCSLNKIAVHDVITGEQVKWFDISDENKYREGMFYVSPECKHICLMPNALVALVFSNKKVKLLDLTNGNYVSIFDYIPEPHSANNYITSISSNKKGTILALTSMDKTASLWCCSNYTLEQLVLHRLLCTWLLIEKPSKGITTIESLLCSIELLFMKNRNVLMTIWATFLPQVQEAIWRKIERLIQWYGKFSMPMSAVYAKEFVPIPRK